MTEQLNNNNIISRVEINGSYYTGKKLLKERYRSPKILLRKNKYIHFSLIILNGISATFSGGLTVTWSRDMS